MIFNGLNEKCIRYMNGCFSLKISPRGEKEIIYSYRDLDDLFYVSKSTNYDSKQASEEFISDNEFKAPPLGYVNTSLGPLYLKRLPLRTWTTGINSGNSTPFEFFELPTKDSIMALTQVLENNYPPVSSLEELKCLAISRGYSLAQKNGLLKLFFRGEKVSESNKKVFPFHEKVSKDFHERNLRPILGREFSFVIQERPKSKLEIDI